MSVDQATVRRIARLARIRIGDDEVPKFEKELNAILEWIEMLNEVDTEDVAPMTAVVEMKMRMREDEITDGGYPERVTANAPHTDDNFFLVPKVIE